MIVTNLQPSRPHINWSDTTCFTRNKQMRDERGIFLGSCPRQGVTPPRRFRYNLDGYGAHAACIAYMVLVHNIIDDWKPLDRSKSPEQRAAERAELWCQVAGCMA